MKRLLSCLILFAVLSQPVLSRNLLPSEQGRLYTQIERFSTALNGQDFETVGKTVPPKIFEFIASDAGVSVEQLRSALTTQMQMALAAVKIPHSPWTKGRSALSKRLMERPMRSFRQKR